MKIKYGRDMKLILNGIEVEMPFDIILENAMDISEVNNFKGLKAQIDNNDWPERDHIPVDRDPIGDLDKKSKVYNTINFPEGWEEEMEKFYDELNARRIKPSDVVPSDFIGMPEFDLGDDLKCDCGTEATYGKVPVDAHSHYCKLVKK